MRLVRFGEEGKELSWILQGRPCGSICENIFLDMPDIGHVSFFKVMDGWTTFFASAGDWDDGGRQSDTGSRRL